MKKTICCLMALLTVGSTVGFAACGGGVGGGKGNDSGTLQIQVMDKGYGYKWLEDLAAEFKKDHPEADVKITPAYDSTVYETEMKSGRATTDLYFSTDSMMKYQYNPITIGGTKYDCLFESLSDVYAATPAGESKTIGDKMNAQFKEYFTVTRTDGTQNVYAFPFATGATGIVINNDVWEASWKMPNTTDELFALCNTIKGAGKTPFIHSLGSTYYNYLWETFAMQYESRETMNKFWDGYAPNGEQYSNKIMTYDGFKQANLVMETFLKPSNGYQHEDSNEILFANAQTNFLNASQKIAMMYNGDWILNESKKSGGSGSENVSFMKTPVISALGTKLGITDAELSAIIDYVDGTTTTAPTFTSTAGKTNEEVIAAVRDSRNVTVANGCFHAAFIPVYSNAKDLAKDFLKLMASDKGLKIYAQSFGYTLPFEYDYAADTTTYNGLNNLVKSTADNAKNGYKYYFCAQNKNRLFSVGGLQIMGSSNTGIYQYFAATSAADYMSGADFYTYYNNKIRDSWSTTVSNAGLE